MILTTPMLQKSATMHISDLSAGNFKSNQQKNSTAFPAQQKKSLPSYLLITSFVTFAILLCAEYIRWLEWDFDDAMIVYRMVHNLLVHGVWSYNLAETYNPSTSVLNPLLIWGVSSIGMSIPHAAHVVNIVCLCLCGIFSFLLVKPFSALLGIFAAHGAVLLLAFSSTWGLEIQLLATLLLLFLCLEQQRSAIPTSSHPTLFGPSWFGWSWVVLGLAVLTRPDAIVMVVIKCVMDIRRTRQLPILGLLIFGLTLLPWSYYSLKTFGSILPNTLTNKVWQGKSGFWGQGAVYLSGWGVHLQDLPIILKLAYILAPLGILKTIQTKSSFTLLVLFCLVQQVSYAVLNVPGYHWYFVLVDLCALLATMLWLASLKSLDTLRWQNVFAALMLFAGTAWAAFNAIQTPQRDVRNESYKTTIEAIKTQRPNLTKLAALEVGTFGYFMPNQLMIDLIGLASDNKEYLSGAHNDEFFNNPPEVVIFHDPLWHFERGIAEDIRFQMLYGTPTLVKNVAMPMQYFTLIKGAGGATLIDVTDFVRGKFSPIVQETETTEIASDPAALCIADHINGVLNPKGEIALKHTLSFRGWGGVPTASVPNSEAKLVALDETNRIRYSLSLKRYTRADVTEHLKSPNFSLPGIEGEAHVLDMAPGTYKVGLLFDNKSLCLTGHSIKFIGS
jgi:arabinofuranosyltransferase